VCVCACVCVCVCVCVSFVVRTKGEEVCVCVRVCVCVSLVYKGEAPKKKFQPASLCSFVVHTRGMCVNKGCACVCVCVCVCGVCVHCVCTHKQWQDVAPDPQCLISCFVCLFLFPREY
jgi:hypothetical protein